MARIEKQAITRVDKAVEKLEPSKSCCREQKKSTVTLQNSLPVPQKVKHSVTSDLALSKYTRYTQEK